MLRPRLACHISVSASSPTTEAHQDGAHHRSGVSLVPPAWRCRVDVLSAHPSGGPRRFRAGRTPRPSAGPSGGSRTPPAATSLAGRAAGCGRPGGGHYWGGRLRVTPADRTPLKAV